MVLPPSAERQCGDVNGVGGHHDDRASGKTMVLPPSAEQQCGCANGVGGHYDDCASDGTATSRHTRMALAKAHQAVKCASRRGSSELLLRTAHEGRTPQSNGCTARTEPGTELHSQTARRTPQLNDWNVLKMKEEYKQEVAI